MKKLIALSFAIVAFSSFACDQYEAQIIAKVTSVKTDSLTYCKAMVEEPTISFYNESITCPLDMMEVISKGIDIPLEDGHDCNITVGQTISGVLVSPHLDLITFE